MKELIVYTDGSCLGNGRSQSAGGMGIYFPNGELPNISKVFRQESQCTNQKTELYAILLAIRYVHRNLGFDKYTLTIKTDSEYSINCVTKWIKSWVKNGWMTKNNKPVLNKEYIEKIYNYQIKYKNKINFKHVYGHTNGKDNDSVNNAEADRLAGMASERALTELKKYTHKPSRNAQTFVHVELIRKPIKLKKV